MSSHIKLEKNKGYSTENVNTWFTKLVNGQNFMICLIQNLLTLFCFIGGACKTLNGRDRFLNETVRFVLKMKFCGLRMTLRMVFFN